jgi:hypothetical protein
MRTVVLLLFLSSIALAGEPKEYKKGTLDHWDLLSTGTKCSTTDGIFTGVTTKCGDTGVRAYHVVTEDGFDYTVQPDTYDPFKALPLGQEVKYRIDQKGLFWTPDPKHGSCPFPCNSEQKKEFKQDGNPNHEAKYLVNLVEKKKVDSSAPLTNKDVIDMSRLGLSEALIIQKINTAKSAFDVSIPALKSLKESGVSDAVVSAMMQRESH